MAWIWRWFVPLAMTKKSAKVVISRRSSTRMALAFFESAARAAVSQLGGAPNSSNDAAAAARGFRATFLAAGRFTAAFLTGDFLVGAVFFEVNPFCCSPLIVQ